MTIFLDAVGTLFDVRGSVGEAYAVLASRWGVKVDATVLNKAFFNSFKTSPAMAFPEAELREIPQLEYDWWEAIAHTTFQTAGLYDRFSDFSAFFAELYDYFATAEPWYLYDDVKPALEQWRNKGETLAIVSNFDSRIYRVVEALELADYFSNVTISTEAGAAKPNPKIFTTALRINACLPEEVLHIGDSFSADYRGALGVGIKAIWLNRNGDKAPADDVEQRVSLLDCL
ncbi:MAG: HAD-IA family hydrolase [Cyanobacteriota bacterium]|nr:HAD-IA family hydrolase [Cyanobacteriota bacterium]